METNNYPPGEFHPRYLSQEEIDDPYLVIIELFAYGHLPGIREQLWTIIKCCAAGDFNSVLTKRERSNVFYFYEVVEKLFEALYLIYSRRRVMAA